MSFSSESLPWYLHLFHDLGSPRNNRAVGVEHIDDIEGRAKGKPTSATSYASRLIVLSAGAFGSPAILER